MPGIKRTVPVIDVSNFDSRKEEIKQSMLEAAEQVGFFQVVGHGIPKSMIDGMFALSKAFFNLDDEVKAKYPFAGWNAGWEKMKQIRPSTGTPDMKESYQIGWGEQLAPAWPSEEDFPGFKKQCKEFMQAVHTLSEKLLLCFSEALELGDTLAKEHDVTRDGVLAALRLLHYPDVTGQDFPSNYWRAGAHTDFDTLTLLFQRQGQGGLEVCPGREVSTEFAQGDEWTPVDPVEDAITINIGDMLMRWSDDRLKSNFHRVKPPGPGDDKGARYSIAYFNQACCHSVIRGPLAKYEPITGADFMAQAIDRNYKTLMALKQKQAEAAEAAGVEQQA